MFNHLRSGISEAILFFKYSRLANTIVYILRQSSFSAMVITNVETVARFIKLDKFVDYCQSKYYKLRNYIYKELPIIDKTFEFIKTLCQSLIRITLSRSFGRSMGIISVLIAAGGGIVTGGVIPIVMVAMIAASTIVGILLESRVFLSVNKVVKEKDLLERFIDLKTANKKKIKDMGISGKFFSNSIYNNTTREVRENKKFSYLKGLKKAIQFNSSEILIPILAYSLIITNPISLSIMGIGAVISYISGTLSFANIKHDLNNLKKRISDIKKENLVPGYSNKAELQHYIKILEAEEAALNSTQEIMNNKPSNDKRTINYIFDKELEKHESMVGEYKTKGFISKIFYNMANNIYAIASVLNPLNKYTVIPSSESFFHHCSAAILEVGSTMIAGSIVGDSLTSEVNMPGLILSSSIVATSAVVCATGAEISKKHNMSKEDNQKKLEPNSKFKKTSLEPNINKKTISNGKKFTNKISCRKSYVQMKNEEQNNKKNIREH